MARLTLTLSSLVSVSRGTGITGVLTASLLINLIEVITTQSIYTQNHHTGHSGCFQFSFDKFFLEPQSLS